MVLKFKAFSGINAPCFEIIALYGLQITLLSFRKRLHVSLCDPISAILSLSEKFYYMAYSLPNAPPSPFLKQKLLKIRSSLKH